MCPLKTGCFQGLGMSKENHRYIVLFHSYVESLEGNRWNMLEYSTNLCINHHILGYPIFWARLRAWPNFYDRTQAKKNILVSLAFSDLAHPNREVHDLLGPVTQIPNSTDLFEIRRTLKRSMAQRCVPTWAKWCLGVSQAVCQQRKSHGRTNED